MGILFASFIIPILPGLVIYGYFYQIMQQIIVRSEEPTLPEWQDWGKLLGDGFRLFGVSFIYSLPMSILYFARNTSLWCHDLQYSLDGEYRSGRWNGCPDHDWNHEYLLFDRSAGNDICHLSCQSSFLSHGARRLQLAPLKAGLK